MKISGKKMGTVKAVKDSLKKGGSSMNTYIKNVPAEGITVRFLTEPEDWFGYYEYWNDEARTFTPMAVGEVLPDGARPSFRYLASAVDIENDKVIPLKLAKTAANSLILKYDKYGTMMDRNYELQKHGEKLDTTYDVTPDAPSKLNLAKYETLDLEKILIGARASSLGETDTTASDDDDDEDDELTIIDADTDDDDDEDDDDDAIEEWDSKKKAPAKKAVAVKGKSSAPSLVDDEDDEDTDDDDSDDEDDDEVYDKDDLNNMTPSEINAICRELGIAANGKTHKQRITAILDTQSGNHWN